MIASDQLYQFNRIEEELQKWVIWPLAITLKDMKAMQADIQNVYHQPFTQLPETVVLNVAERSEGSPSNSVGLSFL